MYISNTTMSNYAQRLININTNAAAESVKNLSSGYRINKAADDAAGLSISEKMRGQIRGLDQASRNIQDGISLVQTADGAMQEISNIMGRMRELSVQAANDTNAEADRKAIQQEMDELAGEVDRISNDTEFNQIKILNNTWGKELPKNTSLGAIIGTSNITADGSLSEKVSFGTMTATTSSSTSPSWLPTDDLKAAHLDFSGLNQPGGFTVSDLFGMGFNSTCATCSLHYSLKFTEEIGSKLTTSSGNYTLEIGIGSLDASSTGEDLVNLIMTELKDGSNSRFTSHYTQYGSDGSTLYVFDERPSLAGNKWTNDTFEGIVHEDEKPIDDSREPFYIQVGANQGQQVAMNLPFVTAKRLGIDDISVIDSDKARQALQKIDDATMYMNRERTRMGAYQNRLEHSITNADNASENLTYAESRIRDANIAKQMVNYSKYSILCDAGNAMLTQTNANNRNYIQNLFQF